MTRLKLILLFVAVGLLIGCSQELPDSEDLFNSPPVFSHEQTIINGADTLSPVRLQFFRDSLYVSYNNLPRIDVLTPNGDLSRTIDLIQPDTVFPTGFVVIDSEIIVTDHTGGVIAIYDHRGNFLNSYGLLPDHQTRLSPFAVTEYGGVLYIADLTLRKILAISNTDAEEITERGELILGFPSDTAIALSFPISVMVTWDGRLLVGDAGKGSVEVFTCDGRRVYEFDRIDRERPIAPQAFAIDNVSDPTMQDEQSFDPSGIRQMGRFHVVDANNGQVHMYNALGDYVASYPDDDRLQKPSGIAIDTKTNLVYIADPGAQRILVYEYRR